MKDWQSVTLIMLWLFGGVFSMAGFVGLARRDGPPLPHPIKRLLLFELTRGLSTLLYGIGQACKHWRVRANEKRLFLCGLAVLTVAMVLTRNWAC